MTTAAGWLTDTEFSSDFPIYTRFNANDVLPDPITPLGASMAWNPHILRGWAAGYVELGAFTAAELGELTSPAGFFYGYLYVNQTLVRRMGIRMGMGWKAIDAAFFNADAPPHDPGPEDVNDALTRRLAERSTWSLTTATFPELEEERALADAARRQRPDLSALSPLALVNLARSLMPLERLMWRGETVAGSQAAVGPAVLSQLLGSADPVLPVQLIGQAGNVDSAAPSLALWELSRLVAEDLTLTREFAADIDGLKDRLRVGHPAFWMRFQAFLADYGYRGPSEWDLGAPSWETDPGLALALVDRLRLVADDGSPAARKASQALEAQSALDRALEIVGDDKEAIVTLHLAIASARRFASWRERGKTNAIKVLHEARMALYELGRRLTVDGVLAHPRQLFMAIDDELDTLAHDPAALSPTLKRREAEWLELFDIVPPLYLDSRERVPALSELGRKTEGQRQERAAAGRVLRGAPGAAGVARGRARVVLDTASVGEFQPGEILVAPQTDPSWTPLFIVAAGVVVDVGALNSHAMIVSRELGIPCATGVAGATKLIADGAFVEVDGSRGLVTVLSAN